MRNEVPSPSTVMDLMGYQLFTIISPDTLPGKRYKLLLSFDKVVGRKMPCGMPATVSNMASSCFYSGT
jgi:hypothetical protein